MATFSYKVLFLKGVKYLVLLAVAVVPAVVNAYPDVMAIPVGTVLLLGANWIKGNTTLRVP